MMPIDGGKWRNAEQEHLSIKETTANMHERLKNLWRGGDTTFEVFSFLKTEGMNFQGLRGD